jgi:hypothetical protein
MELSPNAAGEAANSPMNAPSVLEIIVLMRPLRNSIIVYPGGCVKAIAAARTRHCTLAWTRATRSGILP